MFLVQRGPGGSRTGLKGRSVMPNGKLQSAVCIAVTGVVLGLGLAGMISMPVGAGIGLVGGVFAGLIG